MTRRIRRSPSDADEVDRFFAGADSMKDFARQAKDVLTLIADGRTANPQRVAQEFLEAWSHGK